MQMERGNHEEEADERREAVIASAPSSRPNFKSKSGITDSQLSKFQELHRRRLQIKAKSKTQKRDKGAKGKGKSHKMAVEIQDYVEQEPSKPIADSTSASKPESRVENLLSEVENVTRNPAVKTRQKLFWGGINHCRGWEIYHEVLETLGHETMTNIDAFSQRQQDLSFRVIFPHKDLGLADYGQPQ